MQRFRLLPILLILALLSTPALAMDQAAMDTREVADAVERALLIDPAVPSNDIDVSIYNGVATLKGQVPHLLARERAVTLTETVKGITAVVDLLKVKPTDRADNVVRSDVMRELLDDPAADSYEVDVLVKDGLVTLTGTVESWHEKTLTETLTRGVIGVTGVDNDLQIDYREQRPDAEIQQEIEQALRFNHLVDDGLIDVAVDNGRVQLAGTVGSAAEKRQARYDAWTQGVISVDDSEISVDRWARDDDLRKNKYVRKADSEIQEAVELALMRDPRVFTFDIETSVEGGTVTLRGLVDNLKAKRAAEQDARNTVGVVSTWNLLKVRPGDAFTDEGIERTVGAALTRNPYIERFDIQIDSHDGTVYLDGEVDSYYDKALAGDLASRAKGAIDVVNRLDVEPSSKISLNPWADLWLYPYDWIPNSDDVLSKPDWLIERHIEDEFFWSPFVDGEEISIVVEDGVATLTGTVDSYMEKGAARDNAYEAGASLVRNLLAVDTLQ